MVGAVDTVPALDGPSDPLDEVELPVPPRGRCTTSAPLVPGTRGVSGDEDGKGGKSLPLALATLDRYASLVGR